MAFDVFHSPKIQAGNRVKFSSDETKTKEQGGRYDWIVNDGDGTIGLTEHPDLVPGLRPRLFPSDGVVDCALEVSKSLFDEGSPLVLTTGRIPICLGEEKLFAGRRRYFAFHEDGSMSPLDAPHLRLGVRDSSSETEWESDGKKHRVVAPYLCLVGAVAFARLTYTCESPAFLSPGAGIAAKIASATMVTKGFVPVHPGRPDIEQLHCDFVSQLDAVERGELSIHRVHVMSAICLLDCDLLDYASLFR